MTQRGSSLAANLALAVGVAAVAAIVVVVATPRHGDVARSATPQHPAKTSVYVALPPVQQADVAPPDNSLRSTGALEPFEPPAPPMLEASAPTKRPAGEQVAALTPPEATPTVVPPPLRTVELENHEIHPVPQRDEPMRRVTIVDRDEPAAPPKHADAARPRRPDALEDRAPAAPESDQVGVKLAGPAIVTGALELNIAGKPLRLFGVKPPASGDMCAPTADYAARACPDVSRQALAARIGPEGEVSCRILATGGRQALPAVCKDGTGADLARYLVAHGFALAEPNDMMIDYSAAETQAKNAHTGLWSYR